MKCTIEIDMDNAAFEYVQELPRLLDQCSKHVRSEHITNKDNSFSVDTLTLRDINGNTVGQMAITQE